MINYLKFSELDKARVLYAAGLKLEAMAMFLADGFARDVEDVRDAFGLTARESLRLIRRANKAHYITMREQGERIYVKGDHRGVLKAREIVKNYNACIRSS